MKTRGKIFLRVHLFAASQQEGNHMNIPSADPNSESPSLSVYGDPQRVTNIFTQFIVVTILGFSAGIIFELSKNNIFAAIILGICIFPVLATLYFVRRKRFEMAATFLAFILISLITIIATNGQGIRQISVLAYPAVLIVASLVIREWTMAFLTLYNIACVAWLIFGEYFAAYTPVVSRSTPREFFIASIVLVSTAFMVRLLTSTLFQNNLRLQKELAERKLVEEQISYQANLLKNVSDAIIASDLNFKIVSWNRAAEALYGWRSDEVTEKPVSEILQTEYLSESAEQVGQQFLEKGFWEGEVVQKHKNGTSLNILSSVSLIIDENGQPGGAVAVNRDITDQKLAEKSLQESERRFREMLERVDLAGVTLDKTGRITFINDFLLRITGWSREEVLGENWFERFLPSDIRENVQSAFSQMITGTQSVPHYENEILTRLGGRRLILWNNTMLFDSNGKILGTASIGEDITERKQTEEELRRSEERYRIITELMSDYIFKLDIDPNGNAVIGYLSENYDGITGRTLDQVKSTETWSSILHPDDLGMVMNLLRTIIATGQSGELECRSYVKEGRQRWVHVVARPVVNQNNGTVTEIVGSVKDITERKQAEEALKESLLRQAAILDNIPDLAWLKDDEGRFIAANEPFGKACGVSPADLVGKTDLDIWPEELAQGYRTDDFEVMRTGKSKHVEERLIDSLGRENWIETIKTPIFDITNKVIGTVGIARDITERRRIEEKLRLSEERYRTLAQNLPDSALLLYDQDLRFIVADGPEIEATGFSRRMLEGKTLHEALPPEFAQMVEPNMQRTLAGEAFSAELPYEDRFYRYSYAPLRDSSGNVVMAMILATNITQLKQAEDALKASERRLRTALRATKVGVWEWDMRTNQAYWSDENYRVMGLEPGQTESKYENWAKCVHPEDLPVAEAEVTEAINSRSDLNIEFRVVWPDGSIHWINDIGSLLVDDTGKPLGMYGIQMDITDRKQIQQELEENRRRLAFLISRIPSVIYSARVSGDFGATFVSENVARQMGYPPEKFKVSPSFWVENVHPDDLPRINSEIDRLFEFGSHSYEYRFRHADGHYVWTQDEMTLIRDGSGEPLEIVGLWSDISECKRVEREREALIQELEAKNAELERFTYTVSHDLKSPLVTIKGFLGFLKQDLASDNIERLYQDIERIGNATIKMEQLLRDLLELSRIGRLLNPAEEIPFEELVHEALEIVHGQLEAREVTVDTQPNLPAVYGDRQRLTEVLQNLLDNASKYMGGQTDPRIEIGQRGEENSKPVFYVRDNGIGIDPEHHKRIFGLFNKLDGTSEGTGVGLALVKRIVELHGGRIWVESEPGKGATFYFTLAQGKGK